MKAIATASLAQLTLLQQLVLEARSEADFRRKRQLQKKVWRYKTKHETPLTNKTKATATAVTYLVLQMVPREVVDHGPRVHREYSPLALRERDPHPGRASLTPS